MSSESEISDSECESIFLQPDAEWSDDETQAKPASDRDLVSSTEWRIGPNYDDYDFVAHSEPTKFQMYLTSAPTPLEIFRDFLDEPMIRNIVKETNRYAEVRLEQKSQNPGSSKNSKSWKRVDEKEFWVFLALTLLMGINRRPSIKEHWSTNIFLHSPVFGKLMSRNRYEDILYNLHFVDSSTADTSTRLHKFGSFLPTLLQKFRDSVIPGKNICVDESLLLFKGRLSFQQYIPTKRSRFGIKFFVAVDCATKFVIKIIPYIGKQTVLDQEIVKTLGYGAAVVLKLTEDFTGSGRTIIADNYFTSPILAAKLLSLHTFILGTERKTRKTIPRFIRKLEKFETEVVSQKGIVIERWLNKKDVYMISTGVPTGIQTVETGSKVIKNKPNSICFYNKLMGGVDDMDKIMEPFCLKRKSIKWYKKMALHVIDIAVYNALIVYNTKNKKKLGLKQFILDLVAEIVDKNHINWKSNRARCDPGFARLEGRHFPEKQAKRSRCKLCAATTNWKCDSCEVYLCMHKTVNCFKMFHTVECLPRKRNEGNKKI